MNRYRMGRVLEWKLEGILVDNRSSFPTPLVAIIIDETFVPVVKHQPWHFVQDSFHLDPE